MFVTCGQCGYLPCCRASSSVGWYQIILVGDRGTCVLRTCPGLDSTAGWPWFKPETCWSQFQRPNHSATEPHTHCTSLWLMLMTLYACLSGLDSRWSGATHRLTVADADGRTEAESTCCRHGSNQPPKQHRHCAEKIRSANYICCSYTRVYVEASVMQCSCCLFCVVVIVVGFTYLGFFDTFGLMTGRASSMKKWDEWWFVGGDHLTGALHCYSYSCHHHLHHC